jgi:hypothetical protein
MIEVAAFRVVFASNIENSDGFINQVGFGRFTTIDGQGVFGQKDGTGKKLVLVRSSGMRNYRFDHERNNAGVRFNKVE